MIGTNIASNFTPIRAIEFGILSNEEIKKISVMTGTYGIESSELYDKQEPKKGSLLDSRMGGSGNTICATCQLDGKYCDGHSAHIDLADPIFHILYHEYIKNILECICIGCSNLLISKETQLKQLMSIRSPRKRFAKVREIGRSAKFCAAPNQNCGTRVSKIRVEIKTSISAINFYSETEAMILDEKGILNKKKIRHNLTPDLIADILDNISDEDCQIMGFDPAKCRPSSMIQKVFLVPPIHVRPSVRGVFSSGTTIEDPLTSKLGEIIKANKKIYAQKESNNANSNKYSQLHTQFLQCRAAEYYDPDIISCPKPDGKMQSKSLVDRFKNGKMGRIRGTMMGKRGNFTARTVISSDPSISTNHLRVPVKIAMTITVPEYVMPYNFDAMTELVRNGADKYPGANYLYKNGMESNKQIFPIYLKFGRGKINLQYGDLVERHLMDDDIVILNRQPTLHKQSMMGHRVRVVNDPTILTFGMCVAITTPYNADFDGDEMNVLAPQSVQSRIEIEELADAKNQLISPTKSTNVYGIVQDGLLGAYNMTKPDVKIDWRNAMNLIGYTSCENFNELKKHKFVTGSELFSAIIPSTITTKIKDTVISGGKIVAGQITKDALGAGETNNLLRYVWDKYGEDKTKTFIDDVQRLVNHFNALNGATVSFGDIWTEKDVRQTIKNCIDSVFNQLNIVITGAENNPSYMNAMMFDNKLNYMMATINDTITKLIVDKTAGKSSTERNETMRRIEREMAEGNGVLPDDIISAGNGIENLYKSGARGKPDNLGQMAGCIGLQKIEGSMLSKIYNNRTSCYFHENDDRAKSRAMCSNSYMDGLTYSEFCFHMCNGRADICQVVLKTADTGYAQKKLIKTMEDIQIHYDGTVRLANNQIIQYMYGGNSADTSLQVEYKINMIMMDNRTLEENFKFTSEELKELNGFTKKDNEALFQHVKKLRDDLRATQIKSRLDHSKINISYFLPINIALIVSSNVPIEKTKKEMINPKYVIEQIEQLITLSNTPSLKITRGEMYAPQPIITADDMISKNILYIALYDALHPKKVSVHHNMSRQVFDTIIGEIKKNYINNLVEPGSMVGIIAAQSMGEAVTQMNLNTFHRVGIVGGAINGVIRINELITVTKNPKQPSMKIYISGEHNKSQTSVRRIASMLGKTTFGEIRGDIDVMYDPVPHAANGVMEKDGIAEPFYGKKLSRNGCQTTINNLPWLFRIIIDKKKMIKHDITLMDIKMEFCMWWDKKHSHAKKKKETTTLLRKITSFAMLSNTDNDAQPIIHIRFNVKDTEDIKQKTVQPFKRQTLNEFIQLIDKFKIKGLDSISNEIYVEREPYIDATDGDTMKTYDEYMIKANGTNLKEIRYFSNIDTSRSFTDNITEIFNVFGIEFARHALIYEFYNAYALAGNSGLNIQHIAILVDTMCYSGAVMAANRHGMKHADIDPFTKASFEQPIDILIDAAVFGDTDKMQSVSSRLFIGAAFRGGTGCCDLLLDTQMIQNSEYYETDQGSAHHITENTLAASITDEVGEDIYVPE